MKVQLTDTDLNYVQIFAMDFQLEVNCGFARVAIRKCSEVGKGKTFTDSHSRVRAQKFQDIFSPLTQYGIHSSMFEGKGGRMSTFDRYCKKINGMFFKWKNREKRMAYMTTFSPENWNSLPRVDKRRHTLANCKECALAYREQQQSFPSPKFLPVQSLGKHARALVEQNSANTKAPEVTTRQILSELEPLYREAYGRPLS